MDVRFISKERPARFLDWHLSFVVLHVGSILTYLHCITCLGTLHSIWFWKFCPSPCPHSSRTGHSLGNWIQKYKGFRFSHFHIPKPWKILKHFTRSFYEAYSFNCVLYEIFLKELFFQKLCILYILVCPWDYVQWMVILLKVFTALISHLPVIDTFPFLLLFNTESYLFTYIYHT